MLHCFKILFPRWQVRWCAERQINQSLGHINGMMKYLVILFEDRSLVSTYRQNVDGKPVVAYPKGWTLLKDDFNRFPPQLRYLFIRDI